MTKLNARPEIVNIDAYQGDEFVLTVNVVDSAGAVYDLTGFEGEMTIRQHIADLEPVIAASTAGVIDNPGTGVVVFTFDGDTMQPLRGSYTYDAEVRPTANLSARRTVVAGVLEVQGDVTAQAQIP